MLIYLKQAIEKRGPDPSHAQLLEALDDGAVQRVRPNAMTVAVT